MENLLHQDGELYLFDNFYGQLEAEHIFNRLLENLPWHSEEIVVVGKRVQVPRLICWYGDPGAVYQYSSVQHEPLAWTPELLLIKEKIQACTGHIFNSVLANLYRNGQDSMGWHADKEKELGMNPVIASLSLGEQRLFKLQHNKTKQILDIQLQQGNLVLMAGPLQHHWRHSLPKTKQFKKPRINLTFRKIQAAQR